MFNEKVKSFDRLAEVKETFDEASDFINESAEDALEKHEEPGLR